MKLTQLQVNALAYKIYKVIYDKREVAIKKQKAIDEKKFNKSAAAKHIKALKAIDPDCRIIGKFYPERNTLYDLPRIDEIRNDIIISNIDPKSFDAEQFMADLIAKYSA
jgi:hypothetical protein